MCGGTFWSLCEDDVDGARNAGEKGESEGEEAGFCTTMTVKNKRFVLRLDYLVSSILLKAAESYDTM